MQIVNERCYNSFMESNIIEKSKQNPYDEVYSILITLENDFINKLPKEILNNIIKNMSFTINNGKKKYNIQRYNLIRLYLYFYFDNYYQHIYNSNNSNSSFYQYFLIYQL